MAVVSSLPGRCAYQQPGLLRAAPAQRTVFCAVRLPCCGADAAAAFTVIVPALDHWEVTRHPMASMLRLRSRTLRACTSSAGPLRLLISTQQRAQGCRQPQAHAGPLPCCSRPLPGPPHASGACKPLGTGATSGTLGAELPGRAPAGARCPARPPPAAPLPARPTRANPAMQHPAALPATELGLTHMPPSTGSSSGTRWCAALLSGCVGAAKRLNAALVTPGRCPAPLLCCAAPLEVPVSYLHCTKPLAVTVLGRQLAVWCARCACCACCRPLWSTMLLSCVSGPVV